MKSGPAISSSVGFLIACTVPQKCPLPLPRSRNQRPPGQGSSFIGIGVPSCISLCGPSCSSSAANVASSDARTRISSFTVKDKLSIPGRVRVIFSSFLSWIGFCAATLSRFRALLDTAQLMAPEALEGACPLMQRPDGLGVRAVEHVPSLAPHVDEPDLAQNPQVLGDRRLLQIQAAHDLAHRALLKREKIENVSPPRLGYGVKSIRCCGRPRHGAIIHSYTGICQAESAL